MKKSYLNGLGQELAKISTRNDWKRTVGGNTMSMYTVAEKEAMFKRGEITWEQLNMMECDVDE